MAHAFDEHPAIDCRNYPATAGLSARETLHRWAEIGSGRIRNWIQTHRQRRTLRELGDHQLDDIGVSRAAAEREAARLFWT
jgi:uncharacterized protein YjiS (DUF1127 family)